MLENHRRWLAIACLPALLASCAREDPERRLRQSVAELETAIETRDTGAVRALLAEDFIGPQAMDRQAAVRLAQLSFLRHRDIGVALAGPLQVQLQPQHASVSFDAALTGGSGRLLPDAARLYRVDTGWRLDDGEWRLVSADWEPVL